MKASVYICPGEHYEAMEVYEDFLTDNQIEEISDNLEAIIRLDLDYNKKLCVGLTIIPEG